MKHHHTNQNTAYPFRLDFLSPDICEEIAKHITGGHPTETALHFAESGTVQCQAVLSTLSFRLRIDAGMQDSFRWTELFKDKVKELELDWCPGIYPEPHLISILRSPSLRSAEIADHPAYLRATVLSSSIKDLTVISCHDTRNSLLFRTLSTLHLSRLSIRCARKSPRCYFLDETLFNQNFNVLTVTCPHLSALNIDCKCSEEEVLPIWHIFPLSTSLREVSLESKDASEEEVCKLRTLKTVRIGGKNSHGLAVRVGSPVTELSDALHLNEDQILALGTCHRLAALNVRILPGAERDLHYSFSFLTFLRELQLHWSGMLGNYYKPAQGLVLNTVKKLPGLTHLALTEVLLACEELAAIQEHMGSRLHEFQTMVSGQEEPTVDRLIALLQVAIEHNPSLRVFDISTSDTWDKEPGHPTPSAERQRNFQQIPRIRLLMEKLKRRAPFLDLDPLECARELLT